MQTVFMVLVSIASNVKIVFPIKALQIPVPGSSSAVKMIQVRNTNLSLLFWEILHTNNFFLLV